MADKDDDKTKPGRATRAAEAGRRKQWTSVPGLPGGVVTPPIWRASTHLYDDMADLAKGRPNKDGHFYYGRRGGPTQWSLAEALTELEEGATGTQLYPSGVAAIAGALLSVLDAGDVLLVTDNVYEPTRILANRLLGPRGIETRYFDPLDVDGFADQFCERTKAVMLESPGSLTMEVCDIPALAAIAQGKGAVTLCDNTWASAIGFAPLRHGCDIAITSLTKHAGGHSDVMMGSVSTTGKYYGKLRLTAQMLGHVVSPDDAALVLRGLRTMPLRLERSTATALALAEWLARQPQVAQVLCPMLPGSPGHDFWARDFTGGCGLFSFVIEGRTAEHRARFLDALNHFGLGYSWGGFESLALPINAEGARSATAWPPANWGQDNPYGVRLSIGLEDEADLRHDVAQALAAMDEI